MIRGILIYASVAASLTILDLTNSPAQEIQVQTDASNSTAVEQKGAGGMSLLSRLPVHLSLAVHGGYDDNTNLSTVDSNHGSWFTDGRADLAYNFSNGRTTVKLTSGAHITYYPEKTGGGGQTNDLNIFGDLSLTHHLTDRLKLDASIYAAYQTEPTFSSDVGTENVRTNYFLTADSFDITYNWVPRFSTVTGDRFQRVKYQDSSVGGSLDRLDNSIDQQFKFGLFPERTDLVGEYRFQIVDYDNFPRDSTTHSALIGVDQGFSPDLHATVRGGATFRSYTDDGNRTDPRVEGTLSYRGAHSSSLSWSTSYGLEEPNATQVQSRLTFRTGLTLGYQITSRITAHLGGDYHHDQNNGFSSAGSTSVDFSEDTFNISGGLRYAIKGFLTFDVTVEHSEINSGQVSRDYSRNRYSAGLSFTY